MGIASLGGLLSGAGDVNSASPRNTGRDYRRMFNTYLGSAQPIFDVEQRFRPQYSELGLQNLGTVLNGSGGAPGLIDLLGSAARGARSNNYADYASLNPMGANLMGQLNDQASSGLAAGGQLTPEDTYRITNAVRSDWANRGLGASDPAQLNEAVRLATGGEDVRQARQNFAMGVEGMNQGQFDAFSDRQLPALAGAFSASSGPSLYSGNDALSLLNSIYGAKNAANLATAQNATGLYQSMDANQSNFISGL